MFQRCKSDGSKIHTHIENFVASQISISGKTYTTIDIIFHEGNNIQSGHYRVHLRNKNGWSDCDDNTITVKPRFPYNKLPNSYVILLQTKF